MVNFDSISIGLEVEFMIDNKICSGIVKYKGPVNCKDGLWVGIEANEPIGDCDGRIIGRTYFKCPDKYGIFLSADQLRLMSKRPKKKNHLYKSINSQCDELLFKSPIPKDYVACITDDYLKRAQSSFEFSGGYDDLFRQETRFSTRESLVYQPKKVQVKKTAAVVEKPFHPVASIPQYTMPDEEMQIYTKLNWSYKNVKMPRYTNKNNTYDSFNKSRSNYIGK